MFGEYIPSNQGTTHDIHGSLRSSAVDGRSPYIMANQGTVDSVRLRDGQSVRVSAVDGRSPYIAARSNGDPVFDQAYVDQMNKNIEALSSSHGKELGDLKHKLDITSYLVYGSLALNVGLIAYCAMKK